jgi:acyl carrier protein
VAWREHNIRQPELRIEPAASPAARASLPAKCDVNDALTPRRWNRQREEPARTATRPNAIAMETSEALHAEIKALIVDVLMLEDTAPSDIASDEALFIDGLGLDSIDALELAMGLEEKYGVVIKDDPEKNEQIFRCVRSLAEFVTAERTK